MSTPAKLSRLRTLGRDEPAPRLAAPPDALTRLFSESVFGMPPWMLTARLSDFSRGGVGVPLGVATGTPTDRKGGRDVPLFWSELDLRGYRILARHITDTNPFGKGFVKLLTNYHVRKGFGWQACRRGAKKQPYQTGRQQDPLVAKAQEILDRFRDAVKWPLLSREAFRRWCRDGELLGRWFFGGYGRLPQFRFVEPDNLGSPTGNNDDDDSFGIRTPEDDPAGPALAYHLWNADGVTGEWVEADRVIYCKRNTDSTIKRGLPDFHPVAAELEDCTKLVRTMLATAIRQAGTAWIEKFQGRGAAQVSAAVPEYAAATGYGGQARAPFDSAVPWWLLPQVGGGVNPWEPPGVVRKVEGDRQYEAGPTSTGVPGYVQVEQAALRGCGVIWSFPEYFSGDASNANLASTFAAGTPFTVEVESSQYEFGAVWERPCALKVLQLACEAGLIDRADLAQLDVEVTEPAVVIADPGKDTDVLTKQLQAKIVSLDTARQKLGYDPQHESAGVEKDAQQAQPPQQPPGGGDPNAVPPQQQPQQPGAPRRESKDASGHEHAGALLLAAVTEAEHALASGEDPQPVLDALFDLADDPAALARALGAVSEAYSEDDHPRDDRGRFVAKSAIAQAQSDPAKADELRAKVTDPKQRAKLDAALGDTSGKYIPAKDHAKRQVADRKAARQASRKTAMELVNRIRDAHASGRPVSADDLHALIPHLSTLDHDALSNVRVQLFRMGASFGGTRKLQERADRLTEWARRAALDARMDEHGFSDADKEAGKRAVGATEPGGKPAGVTDPGAGKPAAPVDLSDHAALAAAVSGAAERVPGVGGATADPNRGAWEVHKAYVGDVYDELARSGALPPGTTLDALKAALLAAHRSGAIDLSRDDLPQFAPAGHDHARHEIKHPVKGEFHLVRVLGRGRPPAASANKPGANSPEPAERVNKPTPKAPRAKPGEAAVRALAQSEADPLAKDYIESALHNVSDDARGPDRARELLDQLGAMHRTAAGRGEAGAVAGLERAVHAAGGKMHGPAPGEQMAFDSRLYASDKPAFPGDKVRVVRRPVVLPGADNGRDYVAQKGHVEPV